MNLEPTETQTLLRDTVREYLEREVPFARVREVEARKGTDEALYADLIEHGWLGVAFPQTVGGGDGTLVDAGLLVEEMQRRAAIVPIVEVLCCAAVLHRFAPEARAGALVREILEGRVRPVPAVLEKGDSFDAIDTHVDDDTRLRGSKYFVDFADFATHHLVAAREGNEIGLYLVETAAPGLKSDPTYTMGRLPQAIVRYDGAPAEKVAGADGYRFLVQLARVLSSVQMTACMQQSLDMSVAYTAVREQFGQPIGSFQAVHHHCADMSILVESSRFLAYEALEALERGTASAEQVAVCKAAASRALPDVVMLGHQVHGGQGYIEENDLYFFTLRGKDRSLAWGTAEECLAEIARGVDAPAEWL